MDKIVTAADANRRFSEILRGVRDGQTFVVTSHGRPVARIAAVGDGESRTKAYDALMKRLRRQAPMEATRWSRDELYED